MPQPRLRALLLGLAGWLLIGASLGLSVGIASAFDQAFGLARSTAVFVQAALMSALVVPAIVLLRRRVDHRSLGSLGLSARIVRPLTTGIAVGVGTGLVVWVPAWLAGWIRVDDLDPVAFARFVLVNGIVLALFEALPEELALRGYMWTNLRDGWGLVVATLATTALFPFVGLVVGPVRWLITTALGDTGNELSVFPAGNEPVVYVVQLALFGLALVAARRLPMEGALLVAVAFHWTQLSVTRTVLGGTGWLESGWTITWVEPDAIALVLVHIVLAGAVFVTTRQVMQRRVSMRS
ncbi:type II CAAX prenyl endopeptidase Rce1 family protein [Curtobacterium sp. ME12]|uniref:CPBP family glutamic-type intramembrane protease n=1 Tax=Curtobacterium sp. ME12 TaxID=2744253 RepID=UPI0021754D3E|nr:CPBP family glutamic-type intramembrane protease [Curtobacterium sp. ME12]